MRKGIRRRRRERGGTRIRGTKERQNAGPYVHSAAGRFLREIGPHLDVTGQGLRPMIMCLRSCASREMQLPGGFLSDKPSAASSNVEPVKHDLLKWKMLRMFEKRETFPHWNSNRFLS